MCGIAGIINSSISSEQLEAHGKSMLNTLVHRGPDDEGVWVSLNDGLLMGHRRLAIQDLSEQGAQPMFSNSGRYCVVYNGEIYNFRELASDLAELGYKFRGHSDSEVLLEAINEWGLEKALYKFKGMFAFALWDIKEKVLHLCRDRIGEKPLYYGLNGKSFYFASELKAIEKVVGKSNLDIDVVALNCFLRYGYINAPSSIYQGIFKLLPGTVLTICKNDIAKASLRNPVPFWDIYETVNQCQALKIETEYDAIDQLDSLLKQTIRRQLIADVDVGTFLSGGIDSTLVSSIAQSEASKNIKTFTIGFQDKEYDETAYAREIAHHIGSDHHEVYVSAEDALNVIPSLATIYDEPFADSSQIPTYLVSKIAKQNVTVCLSGDGGDELFAGYNRYMWLVRIWNKVNMMPHAIRKFVGKLLSLPSTNLSGQVYSTIASIAGNHEQYRLSGLKLQKLAGLLQQEDIRSGYDFLISYWNNPGYVLSSDFYAGYSSAPAKFPSTLNFIEEAMYWDQISYLPDDNLVKVDRASMSVSLETRLPLLSHEVVEYAWKLPLSFKVKNNTGKWVLRKVLDQYVPNHLVERPKMGFSVPISTWLQNDLKEWAEDLLFSESIVDQNIFQMDILRKIWKDHLSGKNDHSHRLWTILMLLSWRDNRI
jgi:asparagine synthase (glutamine-hydrolysing)